MGKVKKVEKLDFQFQLKIYSSVSTNLPKSRRVYRAHHLQEAVCNYHFENFYITTARFFDDNLTVL